MTTYEILVTSVLAFGGIPSTVFTLYYGARVRWWGSSTGIHLLGFTLIIALVLDLSVVRHVFGPWPGLRVMAVLLYFGVAIFMWQRLLLLRKAQKAYQPAVRREMCDRD